MNNFTFTRNKCRKKSTRLLFFTIVLSLITFSCSEPDYLEEIIPDKPDSERVFIGYQNSEGSIIIDFQNISESELITQALFQISKKSANNRSFAFDDYKIENTYVKRLGSVDYLVFLSKFKSNGNCLLVSYKIERSLNQAARFESVDLFISSDEPTVCLGEPCGRCVTKKKDNEIICECISASSSLTLNSQCTKQ